ncbi:MAG TPA: hypothetical protein VFE54_09940 [Mucilaginibacter sp.]|jgi:hypothetical protein|nr:hypothetical protein [Mucilaginibacter sp.]
MKKILIHIVSVCSIIQICYGQIKPLKVFTTENLWRSVPTKDGHGFKFTETVKAKDKYVFAFYEDHITLKSTKLITLKIIKINDPHNSEGGYTVKDSNNNYFIIVLHEGVIDNEPYYEIDFFKTTQSGKLLTLTKFECKKIP